jgi:hypothetical protein
VEGSGSGLILRHFLGILYYSETYKMSRRKIRMIGGTYS